jgi:hypothetical protein
MNFGKRVKFVKRGVGEIRHDDASVAEVTSFSKILG